MARRRRPRVDDYLAKEPERRFDPRRLDARYKSIVSFGYPYAARAKPRPSIGAARCAAVSRRTRSAATITTSSSVERARWATSYGNFAPVRSRAPTSIPVRSSSASGPSKPALGWFGKNTMLLNRDHGSYFFLAEIFTDAEFEPTTEPYRDHCGTCRRCLDLCPTGALADGYVMRSELCISYQTIENRGAIPRELRPKLGNWIFGCDICNEVCPWNDSSAPMNHVDDLLPHLPDLLALDDAAFSARFTTSAVKRAKRRGLLRNVAVALGNTRNPDAVRRRSRARSRPSPSR